MDKTVSLWSSLPPFSRRVPPKARYAYRNDALSGILGAVMLGLTVPFFGVIARKTLDASEVQIGLLTVAPVAGNLLSLIWAHFMEGRPKMPFAVWSWIGARALFLFAVFVATSSSFVAMVALFWIIGSIAAPGYSLLIKEIYPDGERARIMAYARVCTLGVLTVVTAVGGPLLQGHNYRFVFPVAALFGIAAALVFNRIPTDEPSGEPRRPFWSFMRSSVTILAEDAGFRWFCAGIFISGFANLMAAPLFTIYQVDVLKVDTVWAAIYAVVGQLVAMGGYVYWGDYIDRRTSHRAVAIGALLLAIIPLGYALASEAWMLIPVAILSGFVSSGIDLAYMNGILQYAPSRRITHYQAVFASLMGARGMVAPFVGVALKKATGMPYSVIFVLIAGMITVSFFVQVIGIRRHD